MFFNQNKGAEGPQDPANLNSGPTQAPIFEANVQNFEEAVVKASMEKPVIAYFTASWCGPCKQLSPLMEKVVMAAGGEVVMAKIDIDQNQELAAALRIQSVPTVFAFFQGRPVDAFQGAVPESQAKAFVEKLVQIARSAQPDALDIPEALNQAAQYMAGGDLMGAQAVYGQILQQDENNVKAFVGLVRVYIAAGQVDHAAAMVENAPEDIKNDPNFSEAQTALELASMAPAGSVDELVSKVAANADDHQARFDLALAQFAAGQKADAMDSLLAIIERKADWNEEAARKQLLKFFEALGHSDPLTVETRRRLSALLFS